MMNYNEIKTINAECYNSTAQYYRDSFSDELSQKPFDAEFLQSFADRLPDSGSVLDVGCGSACQQAVHLNEKHDLKVTGIDISANAILLARIFHPQITFEVMDMTSLEFMPNHFDGINAFYSLIHLPENQYTVALAEFARVLKPGGHLTVTGHLGDHDGMTEFHGNEVYFRAWNEQAMTQKIEAAGFSIVEQRTRKPIYEDEFPSERVYFLAKLN